MLPLRRAILGLATLFPLRVRATILMPIPLADTIKRADVIALVRVTSGRMVRGNKDDCGARYIGEIVRSYKGNAESKSIEFGPYYNLRIGGRYLIFLVQGALAPESYLSTNSKHLNALQEFHRECKGVAAAYAIMNSGRAAMPIEDSLDSIEKWIIEWSTLIEPPKNMRIRENRTISYVEVTEFERVFRSLRSVK